MLNFLDPNYSEHWNAYFLFVQVQRIESGLKLKMRGCKAIADNINLLMHVFCVVQ